MKNLSSRVNQAIMNDNLIVADEEREEWSTEEEIDEVLEEEDDLFWPNSEKAIPKKPIKHKPKRRNV